MADATLLNDIDVRDPNSEVVQLEVSDGETYVSKKFGSVNAATATANSDVDAALNVVTDGSKTVTINFAGAVDSPVTLVLYGKLGN